MNYLRILLVHINERRIFLELQKISRQELLNRHKIEQGTFAEKSQNERIAIIAKQTIEIKKFVNRSKEMWGKLLADQDEELQHANRWNQGEI